jgi:predicted phosphate transport protein (TIGR00153 family)
MVQQYGVLAYEIGEDREPRFLLITSRSTRRWVIPRGNPNPGLSPWQSAAQEAYEEAGLTGVVSAEPIGRYDYRKRRGDGSADAAHVEVFPLRITTQSDRFPERHERERRMFSRAEAAEAVEEQGLKDLILRFTPPASAAGRVPIAAAYAPPPAPAMGIPILRLFRRLMPREDAFFDLFQRHAETIVAGADQLAGMFSGAVPIADACARIDELESQADAIAREVLLAVRRSFITPFDRSAITALVQAMDDAIDEMHETGRVISLYDVERFEPTMCEMAALSSQAARLVMEAIPLMKSVGKNGAKLDRITENIVHLEGAADHLHSDGLKALFQMHGEERPMRYFVGREVYRHLERVMDGFEDVADEIQGIVIDHA